MSHTSPPQDEGTFSLGNNGRNALKSLGSRLVATLSWRDMWVFMTVKGGAVLGEDVGKSVDVQSWGLPVTLYVTIPLADSGELWCGQDRRKPRSQGTHETRSTFFVESLGTKGGGDSGYPLDNSLLPSPSHGV